MNELSERELRAIADQLARHHIAGIPLDPRACGTFAAHIVAWLDYATQDDVRDAAAPDPEPILLRLVTIRAPLAVVRT